MYSTPNSRNVCKHMSNIHHSFIYLDLRKNTMLEPSITIGQSSLEFTNSKYIEIKTVIQKKRQSKTGCRNYEHPEDYGKCVDMSMKEYMMNNLGCVPPYFFFNQEADTEQICRGNTTLDKDNVENILSQMNLFKFEVMIFKNTLYQAYSLEYLYET